MDETRKMKSKHRYYKLMSLPLNVPKYLVFKAKPDKNECMKNQCTQFILKQQKL